MKIAVINLARSTDRRELIKANLTRLGLGFEFFAGIDAWQGEHLDFSQHIAAEVPSDFFRPLSAGEIGCFASHYLLWQRCVEAREPLVITEDDVVVDDGFIAAIVTASELVAAIPLVRLGITHEGVGIARFLSLPYGFELVSLDRRPSAPSVMSCLMLGRKRFLNTQRSGRCRSISILIAP